MNLQVNATSQQTKKHKLSADTFDNSDDSTHEDNEYDYDMAQ